MSALKSMKVYWNRLKLIKNLTAIINITIIITMIIISNIIIIIIIIINIQQQSSSAEALPQGV